MCPSVNDADYRKPRRPVSRGSSGPNDEPRTLNESSVHGEVWMASTSTFTDGFYLDSGASLHVTHKKELLHNFSVSSGSIVLTQQHCLTLLGKKSFSFYCLMVPSLLLPMFSMRLHVVETLSRFLKQLVMVRCSGFKQCSP